MLQFLFLGSAKRVFPLRRHTRLRQEPFDQFASLDNLLIKVNKIVVIQKINEADLAVFAILQ